MPSVHPQPTSNVSGSLRTQTPRADSLCLNALQMEDLLRQKSGT